MSYSRLKAIDGGIAVVVKAGSPEIGIAIDFFPRHSSECMVALTREQAIDFRAILDEAIETGDLKEPESRAA